MLADSDFSAPTLDTVEDPLLLAYGVQVRMLRLDGIHPRICGNKWYKLKHNLLAARAQSAHTVLSFGGAYSNHLVALAAASKACGLRSIGIVRGEAPRVLNPALRFMEAQGMALHYISRSDYRNKEDPEFIRALEKRFGPFYQIPEGGSNLLGIKGCAEITAHLQWSSEAAPRIVLMACGTAATLTGVVSAVPSDCEVVGISVLKGPDSLSPQVDAWLDQLACARVSRWSIKTQYHHGGYGKTGPALNDFINDFEGRTGIPLEPVYTGKMMWGLYQMIESGEIARGAEVIALHTGGLTRNISSW
jgi:1-aminocyclopropane-1-carboxylate deaminase